MVNKCILFFKQNTAPQSIVHQHLLKIQILIDCGVCQMENHGEEEGETITPPHLQTLTLRYVMQKPESNTNKYFPKRFNKCVSLQTFYREFQLLVFCFFSFVLGISIKNVLFTILEKHIVLQLHIIAKPQFYLKKNILFLYH